MPLKASISQAPPSLNQSNGFVPVTDDVRHRLIVSVESVEKSGKSHFALTAPGPIYIQNLDNGLEGVAGKFSNDKELFKCDYCNDLILPPEIERLSGNEYIAAVAEYTDAIWGRFASDFRSVLSKARTIIWDTADEAWELIRLARFGKLGEVKPHHYGPVNREFRSLIDMAYSSSSNLIMLHKLKDEYSNDKSTGRKKRAGYKEAGYAAQVSVRCYRTDPSNFEMEILDCRQNPDVIGATMPNDFLTLAQFIFPESEPSEWT